MDITYEDFLKLLKELSYTSDNDEECSIIQTLNMLQGKWVEHILFYLCKKESARFGEIHKAYPNISKTMLSTVLKQLEQDDLVIRKQFNEIPPHTEYSLTDDGKALMPIFYEMYKWGIHHFANDNG